MEETKKTITSLTKDSVSILTQTFVTDEYGTSEQVGSNHRTSYSNSESGRLLLEENEPEEIVATVLQMWGEAPTIETPELPEVDDFESKTPGETTVEERIAELEAKNEMLLSCVLEMSEIVYA